MWRYPSEQMFYNAMKRKGWLPNADDMNTVVQIHNAVNERCWREVCFWQSINKYLVTCLCNIPYHLESRSGVGIG